MTSFLWLPSCSILTKYNGIGFLSLERPSARYRPNAVVRHLGIRRSAGSTSGGVDMVAFEQYVPIASIAVTLESLVLYTTFSEFPSPVPHEY